MLSQILELSKQPHVVLATPGRLADLINSGDGVKLHNVKYLVSLRDTVTPLLSAVRVSTKFWFQKPRIIEVRPYRLNKYIVIDMSFRYDKYTYIHLPSTLDSKHV